MRTIITFVAVLTALASPAWGQTWGTAPSTTPLGTGTTACANAITGAAAPCLPATVPAPTGDARNLVTGCTDPTETLVGDKCVKIVYGTCAEPGIDQAACLARNFPGFSPKPPCDPGYALLAYPGTWTLVCARDLQAPK